MSKIYCKVWSKARNAMVVASELARGAGKGKNGGVRISARSRRLNAVVVVMALGGGTGMAQAADVMVDANGTTHSLNATDTYIKITARNGGTVDANGNAVTILGGDSYSDGSGVVVLTTDGQLVLDGGGTLDNTNTTSGSHGVDAQGTDTQATLNDMAISTKGDDSHALQVFLGATMSVADGTVLTEGDGGYGYQVLGGVAEITGGTVTTQGKSAHGVVADGGIVTLKGGVVIKTQGEGSTGLVARGQSAIDMSGGSITTVETAAMGVEADEDSTLTLTDGVNITTAGDAAAGIHAHASSAVTLNDAVISTEGAFAHGIFAYGTAVVTMSDGDIAAIGNYSNGVKASNDSGVTLTGVDIETGGEGAYGINTKDNAQATMAGGTITTTGQNSHGILAENDSTVTLTDNVMISTIEDDSSGVWIADSAVINIAGGSINTTGTRSYGASAGVAAGSVPILSGGKIILSDGVDITTQGNNGFGLYARGGQGTIEMSGGSITTEGHNGVGARTTNNGTIELTGVTITTRGAAAKGIEATDGSTVTLTDVEISTEENVAQGIMTRLGASSVTMSGGSISTQGRGSMAIDITDDSLVQLSNNVTLSTEGNNASGISLQEKADVTMTGGTITTTGQGSDGIWATGTSQVTLSDGVVIRVEEESGRGIYASSNTQVQMTGGSITTLKEYGEGLRLLSHGHITLDDGVAIHTQGEEANGAYLTQSSILDMAGGSITTEGEESHGILAKNDSTVTLTDNVAISTANDLAAGISSRGDSTVTMTGGSISTTGVLAAGTLSDSNSTMTLSDVAITTVGDSAYGALVNDSAQLTLSNVSITTSGADAMGLSVQNDASAHLNQVTMDTVGASIGRNLYSSGLAPLPIIIQNSNLTQNNGVLLEVTGSNLTDSTVLQLTDGTVAMGDITDVSTTNRNTLALASGAQWTGVSRLDGNLTLTDTGTATHGGTVAVPIQISGDVTVSNGAALGGNLNVGGILSGSGGALRPGNSIGMQTFASAGSFTGDYHAEVNAAGQSDLISVTSGNFDLTGTNLYVDEADGNGGYKLDHDYTIVTTGDATGISGVANNEFANGGELEGSLAASLVKLDPVIYGDDVVKIRLSVDEAKQLTLTHNQNVVVEAAQTNPAVQKAVQMDSYADALDHLSGEIHASTQTALLDTGNLMQRTLVNRMRDNSGAPSCANTAGLDRDGAGQAAGCGLDYPLWAQVVGSWNHHDGDSNTASTRYRLGGLYLGGGKNFDGGWRIGGAVGFTDGKINADDRDSEAKVKSYTAALYGGKGWALSKGQLNLLMGAGYTYHDINTDRNTNVLGSQSLSAGYHANSTLLFAELGYALPVSDATYVEPYLNLGWTDLRTKGFSESGGSTALKADSDHNQIFTQTLGLRSTTALTAGKTDISLLTGLGWRHASSDLDATRTMAFSQGGGESFEIKGAPIAKNAAVLDLGVEARLGESTTLGLSYSGQFSSRGNDNTGSLYLRMKF